MSDLIKTGKKIFTFGVVVTTILWSVGVAALVPVVANADPVCPTLAAGDLVKVSGSRHIYALNNSLQLVSFGVTPEYPAYGGTIFKSWRSDEAYGSYVTVSQACFDTLPNAAVQPLFVSARPGSYLLARDSGVGAVGGTLGFLVRGYTGGQLYAVLPNNIVATISPEVARVLYGTSYSVVKVPVAFWGFTNGTPITEAKAHAGMLVKKTSDLTKTYYVESGNVLREVTASGMTANRFKASFVRSLPDSAVEGYTAGETISALVNAVADRTQSGGVSSTVTSTPTPSSTTSTVQGTMTVALAADTPAAGSIIADSTANEYPQAVVPFAKLNFTAGSSGAVKITTLKLNRIGIAADSDIGNLYLYDGDTKLAEYTSFSTKVVTFTNSAGLFSVPAGTTKAITVKGDLARASTSVSAGKTIGFAVNAAADVVADGVVGGTFPMNGNLMTTAAVSDLGHVYVSAYTSIPSTIKADEANKEVWRFSLTADSQKMQIKKVMLTMVGTIAVTDITNLKLEAAGVQVGTTTPLGSDKTITFDLSASPLEIPAGQTKVMVLRGSMAGGSGRTFKFSIQKSADLVTYDTNYGVYVSPAKDALTTAFTVIQYGTGTGTSVDSGTITVGVTSDSPTGNIADAGTALTLAKFSFAAAGEAVKVDNLSLTCSGGDTTDYVDNLKLMLDGSQIGTTDTTILCNNSETSPFTFGNTFIVPAGTTKVLSAVGDLTDSTVTATSTISVSLVAGSSGNATGQTTFTSLNTAAQTGRTLTVRSGTVSVVKNAAFADRSSSIPNGTVNAAEVKIGSFIITAGSGEAVDVTQVALYDQATTQLGDNFQNLKIKNGAVQIGSTIASLNTTAGGYTFTPSSAIRINNGQQYVVDLYADIKSSASGSQTLTSVAYVDSITATGVSTSADASYSDNVDLQAGFITGNGALTVTVDNDTPVPAQLVMGVTDVTLAKWKLAADASEDIQISDLTVSVSNTIAGVTGTYKNLKLYMDGVQVGNAINIDPTSATSSYANANFNGINLTIPKNNNKVLTLKADISTYDEMGMANTGRSFLVALLLDKGSGNTALTARGVSSGSSISAPSANRSGNLMTVYRTKVSLAWAADSPSGSAVGGSDAIVGKVVITNASNVGTYDARVALLNVDLSNTGVSNTALRYLKIYKDSVTSGNLLATTDWGNSGTTNAFGDSTITAANFNSNTPVSIAAGVSKTFIITLDTNDAGSTDKVSLYLNTDDVTWDDGESVPAVQATTVLDSLPLSAKTLSY